MKKPGPIIGSGLPGSRLRRTSPLLLRIDADATVRALGRADPARLQRHKDVIVTGLDCNAVRIGVGSDILQPLVGLGINDAQDRPGGHVSGRQVIAVVARVVPGLVDTAHVGDGGENSPGSTINYVLVRREGHTIMVRATYQEVVAWALNDTGCHAARHVETVDDHRAIRAFRIDYVYRPNCQVTRSIPIRNQAHAAVGIEGRAA